MPEGDTVWRTARRLHAALAGRPLAHADLRVPRHATADLVGRVVIEVVPRGKHLLTRFEPDLTLHTHLGMDGSWLTRRVRDGSRLPGRRDDRVRAVLTNGEWTAIGELLARVDLVPTAGERELVGHLGPDLLGPDWDPDGAVRRLRGQPDRPVAEALLDQANLAGLGNLYVTETLFLRGVHPHTRVRHVPDLDRTVRLTQRLLWVNRDHSEQATTGDLRRGRSHWVYGRAGRPCRRCRTPVTTARYGLATQERTTFWCPSCQPTGPR